VGAHAVCNSHMPVPSPKTAPHRNAFYDTGAAVAIFPWKLLSGAVRASNGGFDPHKAIELFDPHRVGAHLGLPTAIRAIRNFARDAAPSRTGPARAKALDTLSWAGIGKDSVLPPKSNRIS